MHVQIRPKTVLTLIQVFLASFLLIAAGPKQVSEWEWEEVPRVVAMGDVHGNLDKLTAILQGTGVVNDRLRWTGGSDHVVLCGDMVDRGPADREVLDLVKRLQKEAARKGGWVHALWGNHELMNLVRDFRFVSAQGFASFAKEERAQDRHEIWLVFQRFNESAGVSAERLKASFDEQYPPGYFARQKAFGAKGDYGSWLIRQPILVKINGIVFLHGGLTPEVAALGIEKINRSFRESIPLLLQSIEVLDPVVAGVPTFANLAGAALYVVDSQAQAEAEKEGEAERPALPPNIVLASRTFLEQTQTLPFLPDGPLWYRGNSSKSEEEELARFERVLELLDARAVMVGHTSTRNGLVTTRFGGRLYRGDVGMGFGRPPRAVVFQGLEALVYDPGTHAYSPPQIERPQGDGSLPVDVDASTESSPPAEPPEDAQKDEREGESSPPPKD